MSLKSMKKRCLFDTAVATICLSFINAQANLDKPVEIAVTTMIDAQSQVVTNVTTNLPAGTILNIALFSLPDSLLQGEAESSVSNDGTAKFDAIGPRNGLPDGDYMLDLGTLSAIHQPDSVRMIIGQNGKYLKGDCITTFLSEKTVQLTKVIKISHTSVKASPFNTHKLFEDYSRLYNQLSEFKRTVQFNEYGFSQNGPFYKWLKEVEDFSDKYQVELQARYDLIFKELASLGFSYLSTKGEENDFTLKKNARIKKMLGENK